MIEEPKSFKLSVCSSASIISTPHLPFKVYERERMPYNMYIGAVLIILLFYYLSTKKEIHSWRVLDFCLFLACLSNWKEEIREREKRKKFSK